MTPSYRRELNNGFGNALSLAFEFAVTPAIFGFLGMLLDRRIGTVPVFTLLFTLFVLGYLFWKSWKRYELDMAEHEAALSGRRAEARR